MREKRELGISENEIPFPLRLRELLRERGVKKAKFGTDTGIARRIFYKDERHNKSTLMAVAYYLGITVEELVEGTTAMDDWYR